MKPLTIGELAKRAEVSVDTIRYYERRGLIPAPLRRESGYRQYGEDSVARIQFIKNAKELGFSLNEISELLSLRLDPNTTYDDVKKKVKPKLDEIRKKIHSLGQIEKALIKLVELCDKNKQSDKCPILEALAVNAEDGEIMRLMDRIGETVKGNITKAKLNCSEEGVRKYILKKFAQNGKAPTPAEIMTGLGLSSMEVVNRSIEKLANNNIVLRRDGKIVSSYPFSAVETRHRVIFEDGREVYALCSTDAVGIHFMLGENITVLSKCPEAEKEIKIVVKNGRIESFDPPGIVEFVSMSKSGCYTTETFCPHVNFFSSIEHLEKWRKKNPEYISGEMYFPDETLRHGKSIFGDFLNGFPCTATF